VYDLVREQIYTATDSVPLVIPEEAVVVPGSRAISHPVGQRWNLSLYSPIIVKYRDARTNERVQLESLFR
jgi:2,3,4,5-tetrahydropyridine-2-carboxylate N-succinyltransferase